MSTPQLLNTLFFLRYRDLVARGIFRNRMSLYRAMQREHDPFPKPYRIGANTVVWKAEDVAAWLERRASASQSPEAA